MRKKNPKNKFKKRALIHKHRFKKTTSVSPRKGRQALLSSVAEVNVLQAKFPPGSAASCSRNQQKKPLREGPNDSSAMAPRPVPFQKFKDPAVKKPIHRFKNNNHNDKTKFNYAQKLANSIKRRALTSSKKSPNKVTKRKLNFQTLPKPKMLELPKPTFYGNKKKENDNIEDGEIIEEIMSSDDDDCIVLEPIVHKIEIKDDDDGNGNDLPNNDIPTSSGFIIDKKREPDLAWNKQKSNDDDGNGSDLPSNEIPTSSSFIIDKKREPQLAWNKQKSKADKGLFYIKKTAVIIDSITIDDSFDQSYRVDSPVKIVDDRKPIAIQKEPSNDESVIIVEDCDEDFIPLPADDDKLKQKRAKGYVDPKVQSTPKRIRERMNDSLFTTTERKKLADYNSNTYNPGTTEGDAPVTHKRPIIIDGSNVAFGHGCSNTFSAEGIKYCVDYFEKMGHDVKAVIPLYRRNPHKSSNPALLEQLYKDNKLVCTPCKNLPNQQSISYDDRFILQIAYERNAAVVSNDNYRDLIHENPAFKKIIENRVIGYSWCDNILILPKDPYGRFGPPLSEILRC